MMTWFWQQPDWPHFKYDLSGFRDILFSIAEKMGLITGKLDHLAENLQTEAVIELMVKEAIKTSAIEGEKINDEDIRSSLRNKLGLNEKIIPVHDKRAKGIAELMLDVRKTWKEPLTDSKLFDWHLMLSFSPYILVGRWRIDEEPMQVVSGHHGRWIVHYEAPPAKRVPAEMEQFIHWFNHSSHKKSEGISFAPVKAAIAHLYFEIIHPFEDGNGRIGRALAEKALSQGLGYPVMLSLSQAIESDKKSYYAALKAASRGSEITDWIHYFLRIILKAQTEVETQINFILQKSLFYQKFASRFNERQQKVIKKIMQAGTKGDEGGMSAKKYMIITDVSKATATRDLQELVDMQALKQIGSGRSVRYELEFKK